MQAFSEILSAIHRMGCVLYTVPPGPSPRARQNNHNQWTIRTVLHKTVPRSCVEAFLRLGRAAHLDSVPQDPEHASVLRGTEPAHQELRRYLAHCLADDTSIFHSSNSDATGIATEATGLAKRLARRSALGVGALRGRGPPSWPISRSSQSNGGPKLVMALITRHTGWDGPTRDPCESLDKRWGPWGAWLTEAD